ncbi:30S ribosomal protein S13 [Candidatus Peregrinibacteria bacterium CG_4_10_14_0_2_um_filter_38_24]|nr:MAG: 30S ribosomal protein S13 [Candidatus Peregrinibacteria bacterium CG_4_10_14_0_2_um_filter_38_24]
MARIAGVNLPKEKRIEAGLTAVYGVGRNLAKKILEEANVDRDIKVQDLSEAQVTKIRDLFLKLTVEGDLRRKIAMDIKHMQEIGSYKGFRHKKGLPVRGQHTKYNCRTRKGKKKTVANKKVVTK